MFHAATMFAPLALLIPVLPLAEDATALTADPAESHVGFPEGWSDWPAYWIGLDRQTTEPVQHQIRIERRVIIRISPYRPNARSARSNLAVDAPAPRGNPPRRMVERKIGKCLPTGDIGAVRTTRDNRLLFYMKDQRMMAVNLEKACSARDFYQGFYVEPSKDGKLCVDRERLQSRTGVKCKMQRIRQLVPEGI